MSKQDQANDQKGEGMTAAELYEIVKDVPREAWPSGMHYDWNLHGPKRAKHWHDGDMRMSDTTAELVFIGSMTAWLASHNWVPSSHVWRDGARVELFNGAMHRASSLVAALAAACKEAA